MRKLHLAVAIGVLALTGACGSTKSGGGNSDAGDGGGGDSAQVVNVMVSGTASPHALTLLMDPTADFSMVQVSVVDPVVELGGGPPLATGPLNTSAANCGGAAASDAGTSDAGDASSDDAAASDAATGDAAVSSGGSSGCQWEFPTVNIEGITLGLVGKIEDLRPAASQIWVKTGTGAGTAAFIAMEKANMAPITGRALFAVSKTTQTALAALVSGILSATDAGAPLTGDQMQARGYMIGHVVGKLSAGAPPVAGATVTLPTAVADKVDIIYPNATFNGAGTSTAPHGIFLAVPKASATPAPVVATWTVTPPAGSTLTWQAYTSGTQPGAAFVLIFLADEGGG